MMDVDVWEQGTDPYIQWTLKIGRCTESCHVVARYDQDETHITHDFNGVGTAFSVKQLPGPNVDNVDAVRVARLDAFISAVEAYIAPRHRVGEAVG